MSQERLSALAFLSSEHHLDSKLHYSSVINEFSTSFIEKCIEIINVTIKPIHRCDPIMMFHVSL
jgi:hypothetical protein